MGGFVMKKSPAVILAIFGFLLLSIAAEA